MITTDQCKAKVDSPGEKHLRTDHLVIDLERRAISSGLVTLSSQCAQFLLNLGSIMVLARMLNPADFGLIAMLATIMGLLRVFREVGLSTATIQREGITHAQVSNLFWTNVIVSSAVGVVLVAISPFIAWFYKEPRLVPITLFMAVTFPLSGLTVQHTALLSRQMRFKALAFVQVAAQMLGLATGVTMAWLGYGYWALVGMNLVTLLATVLLTYIAVPWRPQAPVRGSGTRPLFTFGADLAVSGFVFSLAKGSDGLAIGRIYGSGAIGLYSRAGALLNRPLEQLLNAVESVFVPMLSRMQNQPDRYRKTFLNCYESMALFSSLYTGLLLALAKPVTLLVLGPQWEGAAIILGAFSVSALCAPLAAGSTWLFASQGRGKDMLRSTSLVSAIFVSSVLIGLPFGPAGVALANSAMGLLVGVPVLYYLAGRQGPVTTADLWFGLVRCVPVWVVVCGASRSMHALLADSRPIVQLVICIPVGLVAGAGVVWMLPGLRRTAVGLINIRGEMFSQDREAPLSQETFLPDS